ncbi:hypothetical protein EBZ80_21310 [bacterium]|nr:hypothetical protein [bacterium]
MGRLAGYYNKRIDELLDSLRRTLDAPRELTQGLTYREFLDIQRLCENLRESVTIRDTMGTHSNTDRDLYRWIAHPNKYPAPAAQEDPVTV